LSLLPNPLQAPSGASLERGIGEFDRPAAKDCRYFGSNRSAESVVELFRRGGWRSRPTQQIAFRRTGACLVLLVGSVMQAASGQSPHLSDVPPQAAAANFKVRTFSSNFSADQVDFTNTSKFGFKWYPYHFFGAQTKLDSLSRNSDGSITLLGDTTGPNGELATASWTGMSGGFVGTAFGGGGYFEATFKFEPHDVIKNDFNGWPSWWSMAIEHMANLDTRQWPDQQEGYEHFIEVDFFEYNLKDYVQRGAINNFGGTLHDWFGVYDGRYSHVTLPSRVFVREVPASTDFTQYHRYGFLWVPATATQDGYAEHYFDGQRVGRRIAWRQYANQAPPPKPPWTFSIIDRNHLVLILGTGPNQPMTVLSVNVWQASDAHNLKR
jgi:hypothetical protein